MSNYKHKTIPYKHQDDAFYFLYSNFLNDMPYGALFMEQGTGKSKVCIDIASNLYAEGKIDAVLLIAPNGVHEQWNDEQVPEHSSVQYTSFVWENKDSNAYLRELFNFIKAKVLPLKWFFVNVEAFSSKNHLAVFRDYTKMHRTLVIVDEATRIKNPDAARTQNIIQALSEVIMRLKTIIAIHPYSKYRIAATGTMVTNSPYDVWSIGEFLSHHVFRMDFFSFRMHFGMEIKDRTKDKNKTFYRSIRSSEMESVRKYAKLGNNVEAIARIMNLSESAVTFILNNPSVTAPYKNLDELKQMISKFAFVIRKDECFDLPPKVYEKVYCKLSRDQIRVYKELTDDLVSEYKDKELNVANSLSLLVRLQQVTGGFFPSDQDDKKELHAFDSNPKLDMLMDDLDECSSFPIIIVAVFVAEIEAITKAIKKKYPDKVVRAYYGDVSTSDRQTIINEFKEDKIDVLIANAKTAGTGLNLQISSMMYFYSNDYSFESRAQMEDRIHRHGMKGTAVYKDLVVKGTIDERILEVLKNKKDLLDYMRDKTVKEFLG